MDKMSNAICYVKKILAGGVVYNDCLCDSYYFINFSFFTLAFQMNERGITYDCYYNYYTVICYCSSVKEKIV